LPSRSSGGGWGEPRWRRCSSWFDDWVGLREWMVFVGGMVRGLLITDPGATSERPTDDVDAIVRIASRIEIHRLAAELPPENRARTNS
jgi:hypothetical protein